MVSYLFLTALAVVDGLPPPDQEAPQLHADSAERPVDCFPIGIVCYSSRGCIVSDLRKPSEQRIFCEEPRHTFHMRPGDAGSVEIDRRSNRIVYVWPDNNNLTATSNYLGVIVPHSATGCNLDISDTPRASAVSLKCEFDESILPTGDPADVSEELEQQVQKARLIQAAANKLTAEEDQAAAKVQADNAANGAKLQGL